MSRFDVRGDGRGPERRFRVIDTRRSPEIEVQTFRTPSGARSFANKLNADWDRYEQALAEGRSAPTAGLALGTFP